jgi:biopolymer transport protein ExbD/biopolymer transport protein TolR
MASKIAGVAGDPRFHVEQNSEINVTPFVDVMLVLLIIFMVAAPLAAPSVKLDLPPALTKPSTTPPEPVYISIKPDGRMYLMNYRTTVEDLPSDLNKLLKSKRDPTKQRIFIRADKNTEYGTFMDIMVVLQDNGYYSVALIGLDTNAKAHQGSLS